MLTGRVTPQRDAVVKIEVLGPTGRSVGLEAAIDTGYNGFLTLPRRLIEEFGLTFVGTAGAALGDGNDVRMDLYVAAVRWENRTRDILVLEAAGDVLLGMAMLEGSRVTMDVKENGSVLIEPLPSEAD